MNSPAAPAPRLALFDCDGTLVDSERLIAASLARAFTERGHAPPALVDVRRVIGLALVEVIARLLPGTPAPEHEAVADGYRVAFTQLREANAHPELLFDGAREMLDRLEQAGWTLGVATGKSRRGLDAVLKTHALEGRFRTLQTADRAAGKPAPDMVLRALDETGVARERAVVVGDTTWDVLMARHAGVPAIGVAWGCHGADELLAAGASCVITRFDELGPALDRLV